MRRNYFKIILDTLMVVLYATLLFAGFTGLLYHEIVGIGIVALIALHLLLNNGWFKRNITKTDNPKINRRKKLTMTLNIALFVLMGVVLITGLLESVYLFPALQVNGVALAIVEPVHKWTAYACGLVLVAHAALHAKQIETIVRQMLARPKSRIPGKVLTTFGAVAATALIVLSGILGALPLPLTSTLSEATQAANAAATVTTSTPEVPTVRSRGKRSNSAENSAAVSSTKSSGAADIAAVPEQVTQTENPPLTLQDYLAGFICTACHKACPLSAPKCGKAQPEISSATTQYQELYQA